MLDVIITGAGIAGLAAAVSLRRAGHRVHMHERSSLDNEVGAAINVPPNASRFLLSWGLDPAACRFVKARETVWFDHDSLEPTGLRVSHEQNAARYGADLWYAHRVDLHSALRSLATDPDAPGVPVTIHARSFIASYKPDQPAVVLANGVSIKADLVVGADGLHSIASETVIGQRKVPLPPVSHYNCCYRFLIPVSEVEADPETRWWNEGVDGVTRLFTHDETYRRLVAYPCRDNTVWNFIGLFYDEALRNATREDYLANVDKSTLMDTFTGFHSKVLAIMNKATEIKRWPLLYRAPIPTWRRGKLVLVGDAAHPMLPQQAQGGAQGLEDGVALGMALSGAIPAQVEERLDLYQGIRRHRASCIQILSSVGQEQSHLVYDELKEFMDPKDFPRTAADNFMRNFGFDVVEASYKVMKEYDSAYQPPFGFKGQVEVPGAVKSRILDPPTDVTKEVVMTSVRAVTAVAE